MKLAMFHLLITKRVKVLSQHPESAIESSVANAFDVTDLNTRTAGKVPEFWVLVLLLRGVMRLFLLHFVYLIILI
jgi:hypothetical protein